MARQGNLFEPASLDPASGGHGAARTATPAELALTAEKRGKGKEWLAAFKPPFFVGAGQKAGGGILFAGPGDDPQTQAAQLQPLQLRPQPLSFWRWPEAPQHGAAMYFVIDRPPALEQPVLLYVGETGAADRRWKGEHDCKRYLAAYGEALGRAGLQGRPSIRFWLDVPTAIKPRRALEQALIRRWQPPFNKETRERWATPFTADPAGP